MKGHHDSKKPGAGRHGPRVHPRVPKNPLSVGQGAPQALQWETMVLSGFNSHVLRTPPPQEAQGRLKPNEKLEKHEGTRNLDDIVKQLDGLPFYLWEYGEDYEGHNRHAEACNNTCCAVHAIGLPENKPGLPRGMFPYEKEVFDASENGEYVWIKKATGLGISEFYLYYFVWEACQTSKGLKGSHIGFITGPREELTVMLIDRIKKLPIFYNVAFTFKNTIFEINGVKFEAFPSNNLYSARGLPKVSRWFLDEADFWEKRLQSEARTVAERYIAKSRAKIFLVSTPNVPNGLFDVIEHEDPCRYNRLFLHYTVGVGYIYTEEDIEKAKLSPSFDREYGLQYLGQEGDVFDMEELRYAVEVLGATVNYANPSMLDLKSMGIDPGYSKSKYAIVITNYNHKTGKIEIIYASEFGHESTAELTKRAYLLAMHFNVTQIFIDASQNGPIRDLKYAFRERAEDYEQHMLEIKKDKRTPASTGMKVVPISFGPPTGDEMITKCQDLLNHKMIAIPEVFRDLIVQLRSATKDVNGKLDKKVLTMDLFDAFRAAMFYYNPYRGRVQAKKKTPEDSTIYSTAIQQAQDTRRQQNNAIFGLSR